MNKSVLLILLVLSVFPALSQQVTPGGVKNLYLWNTASGNGSFATLKSAANNLTDTFPRINGRKYTINNNSAVYFNGNSPESSLDLTQLPGYTLFAIYQALDTTNEHVIFTTEGDTSTETVLTDRRLASLEDYKYANYDSRAKNYPQIYTYCHFNNKDTSLITRKLRLGQTPRKQSLPVQALQGIVPEIILYGRNLSYREKLRVESYLALKYGIPLGQQYPTNYLNSNGDTIWNTDINSKYSNNIAGIGRDDVSGLQQRTSECIQTPGLMKVCASKLTSNNTYILWGDNGAAVTFGEYHNIPKCIARDWKLSAYHASGTKINLQTDALAIEEINPLKDGETYWLMIDRSGTGSYPFRKTNYIKCESMASLRDTIKFNGVQADKDSSGADVFTLLAMPELFTRSTVVSPKCDNNGEIQVEIVGGTSPYRLVLASPGNTQSLTVSSNSSEFTSISQGEHTLTVTDADDQTYTEKVWVSNDHSWECKIKSHYDIPQGGSLDIDASVGMPTGFSYSWTFPSNEIKNTSKAVISQPGTYLLSITEPDGCSSDMKISASQIKPADLKAIELFPNPTKGNFVIRAKLASVAPLTITVSDISGKVVSSTTLKGQSYYWYNGTLPKPGVYLITLKTLNDSQTLKLVGN